MTDKFSIILQGVSFPLKPLAKNTVGSFSFLPLKITADALKRETEESPHDFHSCVP